MSRVVHSFNEPGQLTLRNGETFGGVYHIDVVFWPVRGTFEARGSFHLNRAPDWESVVDGNFAGSARGVLSSGTAFELVLGGIQGNEVTVLSADCAVLLQCG